ncbi:MAG: bifunctional folylpolyglutamate synthase/dihydrofolate synthase, partial [Pseudomonadota bacterium]
WLDGGHNPAAGIELAGFFRTLPAAETHLVCGMLDTKDPIGFLHPFVGLAARLHAVDIPGSTAVIPRAALAGVATKAGIEASPARDVEEALDRAIAGGAKRVLICGSLYLAGDVLRGGAG